MTDGTVEERRRPAAAEASQNESCLVKDSAALPTANPLDRDTVKLEKGARPCRQPTRASQQPHTVFTGIQRATIISFATVAAWFTTISANIYFPALSSIAADLDTSEELISLTVTSYMIFQGLSPPLWSAISDVHGRRLAYLLCLSIYIGACAGTSQTKHYYQLLILRCLQSTGSASTLAIGSGVIGDITTRQNRGSVMGLFQGLTLVMNAVGPIIGGAIAFTLGWRAIFSFLAIFAGVVLILLITFLPETLRALVGNGSIPPRGIAMSPIAFWHQWRRRKDIDPDEFDDAASTKEVSKRVDFVMPFRMLVMPQTIFVLAFLTIQYSVWQMTLVASSNYFAAYYGLNELQIGLCFIANGAGCILGSLTVGKVMDIDYARIKAKFTGAKEDFPLESARMRTVYIWLPLSWAALIVFGWTLDRRVHLAAPLVAIFFESMAAVATQSATTTLLVDIFPAHSASAAAALNLCRCLCGAGGTAAVLPLCKAIGIGPAFSLLTGLEVLSTALIIIEVRYGPKWRRKEVERS